jgi:hypothetical protein
MGNGCLSKLLLHEALLTISSKTECSFWLCIIFLHGAYQFLTVNSISVDLVFSIPFKKKGSKMAGTGLSTAISKCLVQFLTQDMCWVNTYWKASKRKNFNTHAAPIVLKDSGRSERMYIRSERDLAWRSGRGSQRKLPESWGLRDKQMLT